MDRQSCWSKYFSLLLGQRYNDSREIRTVSAVLYMAVLHSYYIYTVIIDEMTVCSIYIYMFCWFTKAILCAQADSQLPRVKIKCAVLHEQDRWGAHPLTLALDCMWINYWSLWHMAYVTPESRPMVTLAAIGHHSPVAGTKLCCLVSEACVWTTCPRLLPGSGTAES